MSNPLDSNRSGRRRFLVMAGALLGWGLSGCDPTPPSSGPVYERSPPPGQAPIYRLAVHPLHNPTKLFEVYQPLVDFFNAKIPEALFILEASRDYPAFEEKIRAREAEFLLPNPWQALQAMKAGFHVIASAGDPDDFRGIFIVRRDSGIRRPADLKGQAVSYPAATALAACIMPQAWLQSQGINVNRDLDNRYVGSQESAILNAYQRRTAAAATWPRPWRAFQKAHPQEAAQLQVIWETPPLINNAFMARNDLPADLVEKVRSYLLALESSVEGVAILNVMETQRFHPANDASYDVVRDYIDRFERDVRPVEAP